MSSLQTGKQLCHSSSPTRLKVLSHMSRFPASGSGNGTRNPQGIWPWRPAGFDCWTSTEPGQTETTCLQGTHTIIPGPKGKEQWPHRKLDQTCLQILEGFLQRWGVTMNHCEDKDTGNSNSENCSLVWALLKAIISPTKQPISSSAGLPWPKQTTEREHGPLISRQWAPLKHGPDHQRDKAHPPTTGPSYQEACTSLIESLIHQRADSRS